uniref:NADH-ubiquinone oxidoreductase chain 4L n=1 Tax=Rediviva intermixta TaxID=1688786 RepID=A0A172CDE4_9HYME|nr:NADH dehydrogenase subunit 4L [Rediviva intermixta]AKS40064.1 NADH dehydrogenase subunit 4L [Rediviva intermixta]
MMINNFYMLLFYLILLMIFKFSNYFLMILISMEFMVLSILMMLMQYMVLDINNDWMILYYLVFSVCESVMGLVLLINMIYLNNNQSLMMKNLKW